MRRFLPVSNLYIDAEIFRFQILRLQSGAFVCLWYGGLQFGLLSGVWVACANVRSVSSPLPYISQRPRAVHLHQVVSSSFLVISPIVDELISLVCAIEAVSLSCSEVPSGAYPLPFPFCAISGYTALVTSTAHGDGFPGFLACDPHYGLIGLVCQSADCRNGTAFSLDLLDECQSPSIAVVSNETSDDPAQPAFAVTLYRTHLASWHTFLFSSWLFPVEAAPRGCGACHMRSSCRCGSCGDVLGVLEAGEVGESAIGDEISVILVIV